jgi:hypothetical protein
MKSSKSSKSNLVVNLSYFLVKEMDVVMRMREPLKNSLKGRDITVELRAALEIAKYMYALKPIEGSEEHTIGCWKVKSFFIKTLLLFLLLLLLLKSKGGVL